MPIILINTRSMVSFPERFNDPTGKIAPIVGIIIIGIGGIILPGELEDDDKTIDWDFEQDKEHSEEAEKYWKKLMETEENRCG